MFIALEIRFSPSSLGKVCVNLCHIIKSMHFFIELMAPLDSACLKTYKKDPSFVLLC